MTDYNWRNGRNNQKRTESTEVPEVTIDTLGEGHKAYRPDEDEREFEAINQEWKKRNERHFVAFVVVMVFLLVIALAVFRGAAMRKKSVIEGDASREDSEGASAAYSVANEELVRDNAFSIYSTTDRLSDIYVGHVDDPSIRTDGEFIQECQTDYAYAIYPSDDWTVDEVIASYTESPDIWSTYNNKWTYRDHFICWTPDYQHCFEMDFDDLEGRVMSGWLLVNGVRVKMFDSVTYDSVEPENMVEKYVAGEWNGDAVHSTDGCVSVYIDSKGRLSYDADVIYYTEEQDPEGLAYTDYVDPWWLDETVADKPEFIKSYDFSGYGRMDVFGYVKVYPDLPGDFDVNAIVRSEREEGVGTMIVTKDGAMLFDKGEQQGSWVFSRTLSEENYPPKAYDLSNSHTCSLRLPTADARTRDVAYFYDGERVLALEPYGLIRIVLSEVLLAESDPISWSSIFGLRNGELIVCNFGYDEEYETRTLATDVISVDFVGMRTFEKADGLYAISRNENREDVVVYLGTEDKQYYLDYFDVLHGAKVGAFQAN